LGKNALKIDSRQAYKLPTLYWKGYSLVYGKK
jgi:hypothetical protein